MSLKNSDNKKAFNYFKAGTKRQVVMGLIMTIWSSKPEMRFNQLLSYLQNEYASQNKEIMKKLYEKEVYNYNSFDVTSYKSCYIADLFYVKDEDFIRFLKKEAGLDKGN